MQEASAEENGFPVGEGFATSSLLVLPYGGNGIGVWLSGRIYVGLSDTADSDFSGVGLIDARLSPEDLKQANDIHRQLCKAVVEKPASDLGDAGSQFSYSVTCMRNGKLESHRGRLNELPRNLAFLLDDYRRKSLKDYANRGPAIVKLDVAALDVQREADKLAVSVKFINSGRYPIMMGSPDSWSSQWQDRLRVEGKNTDDATRWSVELAGLPLANKDEFPDENIVVAAGTSVTFRFLAVPDMKIKRGTYRMNALAVTGISGDGVVSTMGRVNFHSDHSKPATVTFDHDYPSTPEERENFEAQKREAMSSQPFYPGSTFIEEGYYRAVSDSGQRSRFVNRFYRNDPVPEVKNMVDGHGQPLHGKHLGWTWEAEPPADVYAFETQCKPGKVCPRTGHWFARIEWDMTTYPPEYDDSLGEIIHCRQGQPMPASRKASGQVRDDVRWEWIGV
ncbi:hypothetical protein LMG29739_04138 [Paraburkholderia solisilvae]|uniref:Uncharacterized protein n=2 Tax=Paraburkholderia solisilvae TaxID=624376 RepID=A0A6J5EAJ6_9BURK|nr:hypothetical protein LMG29739_04138 [Paraburkholderia solisilvae]